MKLYIGNLCHTTTETDLINLFNLHGSVLRLNLIRDQFTRQSKCFGYVQMANKEDGIQAISALNGNMFQDHTLEVWEARTRDERRGQRW